MPTDVAEPPQDLPGFRYQRHASPHIAVEGGRERAGHRVVIAGGGPVGLALALGLACHGVRSVVLEADDTVCVGSRAICISRRSLQILERLGAAADFMRKGLPWSVGRSFYGTQEVFRFAMPDDPREKFPPMINLQQYHIEQFLLEAIGRCNAAAPGTIDLRWASELDGFDRDGEAVTLQVRSATQRYTMRADRLVACDGGQSFVRKALGLELRGAAYGGRYVIVDIELRSSHPTERRAWFDPPWHRGSTVLMHKQPDDLWRIDWQLRPGESTEEAMRPEAVHAFVQRHLAAIGEGGKPWRAVWSSVYRAGAMTLDSYVHGRVLFAGNAAHALPIFGVRGLNSGFDDADNLAWKLALVARGVSHERLLDSYSQERIQAFHVNAENAMRSTEFMSPPSRGFDLLREAALSLAGAHPDSIARLVNPRQTQAVGYLPSPLSTPDDGSFVAGPAPGELMPDVPLGAGHLSDRLAAGFALVHWGAADALAIDPGAVPLQQLALPAMPHAGDAAGPAVLQALDARHGATYLLRPDGHVAARWRRPDSASVQAALRRAAALEPTP